jgi:hypothetical protein
VVTEEDHRLPASNRATTPPPRRRAAVAAPKTAPNTKSNRIAPKTNKAAGPNGPKAAGPNGSRAAGPKAAGPKAANTAARPPPSSVPSTAATSTTRQQHAQMQRQPNVLADGVRQKQAASNARQAASAVLDNLVPPVSVQPLTASTLSEHARSLDIGDDISLSAMSDTDNED